MTSRVGCYPEMRKVALVVGGSSGIGLAGTAVLWLCSDAAPFMIGSPLVVDGGYMA